MVLTTEKLNTDQKAKARTHLAKNFKTDLLTFRVKFWMSQRGWEFFSEKNIEYVTSPTLRAEDWDLNME